MEEKIDYIVKQSHSLLRSEFKIKLEFRNHNLRCHNLGQVIKQFAVTKTVKKIFIFSRRTQRPLDAKLYFLRKILFNVPLDYFYNTLLVFFLKQYFLLLHRYKLNKIKTRTPFI